MGERALAWIVEERALRAALLPLVYASGVDVIDSVTLASWNALPKAHRLRLPSRAVPARVLAANWSWSRWRAVVGPPGGGTQAEPRPMGNPGSSPISHASARITVSRGNGLAPRQHLRGAAAGRRISMVWSAPDAMASH
jgi:hypothetical protein